MSEPTVPTYRLVTGPIQSAIQSAIWGRSGVAVIQPVTHFFGEVNIGDVIISGEDKWTDVVGNNVYDLLPQDGRGVDGYKHPILFNVLRGEAIGDPMGLHFEQTYPIDQGSDGSNRVMSVGTVPHTTLHLTPNGTIPDDGAYVYSMVNISDYATINLPSTRTIEVLVRPRTLTRHGTICAISDPNAGVAGNGDKLWRHIEISQAGEIILQVRTSATATEWDMVSSGVYLPSGVWSTISVSMYDTVCYVHINGVLALTDVRDTTGLTLLNGMLGHPHAWFDSAEVDIRGVRCSTEALYTTDTYAPTNPFIGLGDVVTLENIPNLTNSPFPYKRVADLTETIPPLPPVPYQYFFTEGSADWDDHLTVNGTITYTESGAVFNAGNNDTGTKLESVHSLSGDIDIIIRFDIKSDSGFASTPDSMEIYLGNYDNPNGRVLARVHDNIYSAYGDGSWFIGDGSPAVPVVAKHGLRVTRVGNVFTMFREDGVNNWVQYATASSTELTYRVQIRLRGTCTVTVNELYIANGASW